MEVAGVQAWQASGPMRAGSSSGLMRTGSSKADKLPGDIASPFMESGQDVPGESVFSAFEPHDVARFRAALAVPPVRRAQEGNADSTVLEFLSSLELFRGVAAGEIAQWALAAEYSVIEGPTDNFKDCPARC